MGIASQPLGSEFLMGGLLQCSISYPPAAENTKLPHLAKRECTGLRWNFDAKEISAFDVLNPECRSRVRLLSGNLYVRHFDIFDVSQEEAAGWEAAEHAGFGVLALFFERVQFRHCGRPTPELMQIHVADLDVLDSMTRHSAHNGTKLGQRS